MIALIQDIDPEIYRRLEQDLIIQLSQGQTEWLVVWPEKQSQHPGALGQQRPKVRLFLWGGNAAEVYPLPVMKLRETHPGRQGILRAPRVGFLQQ